MTEALLVRTVERTGSTSSDLRAALTGPGGVLDPASAGPWPHLSALRARTQTAGRGRSDHSWETPVDGALTVSVVVRPLVPVETLAWLPLLGGLAARDAVAALLGEAGSPWRAWTKWPNDVVVLPATAAEGDAAERADTAPAVEGWGRSRKVVGVLAELVPPAAPPEPGRVPASRETAPAVVLGVGVNVAQGSDELPVPWAASLAQLGARTTPEAVLDVLSSHLVDLVGRWEALGGDPDAADGALGRRLREACRTLGQEVRVEAPAGPVAGRAVELEPGLVLETAQGRTVVTAGDVSSLRSA